MTKEEMRTRIEAELLAGEKPRALSEKYPVPYVTINSWLKKLDLEDQSEAITELSQTTKASLELVRQKAKEEAPQVAGKIDAIVDGVEGLQTLTPEFQKAMQKAVQLAQSFLDEVDDDGRSTVSIKEWQMITSTLASTYAALFNSKGTTVNVAQNTINAQNENMSFFKNSQKAL